MNLERGESRSDRGETAYSRRDPAQIGAAVKDCPAYTAAVLACSLLFSLYAFPLPATPQPFQVFGPRSPPGRLPTHPATCSACGQAAEPFPLRRRFPLPVRPFSAGLGPTPPRAHAAAAAHVQRRFSPTGTVYLHTHSPGLVILSGQYSRPGSPAGRALRGKENLQRSNKGAAFCVRHSDTSSCGRTGMKQASSLALVACRIERVQRHAPAYHLVCTNWIYFNYRRPKSCGLKKYCQLLQ